jgi:FkbM family methyltransferase
MIKELIYNNQTFYMFDNDWVGSSILSGQIWEPHITEFLKTNLTKDSVLVDVGSNYGWHAILSHNLCKEVYSYEPQKLIYDQQLKSIEKNNIRNIKLFNYGIGDVNENKNMRPIDYNSHVHIGDLSVGDGGEPIVVKTLDSLLPNGYDFIKIDVQGYEKYVLEGSINTIKEFKPIIIIEIECHQLNRFGYGCNELFILIKDLGYEIFLLDYHYPSDHVCVHKDKLDEFREKNKEWIRPLTEKNNLNNNIDNGVNEKIYFSEEITYNTLRLSNESPNL